MGHTEKMKGSHKHLIIIGIVVLMLIVAGHFLHTVVPFFAKAHGM